MGVTSPARQSDSRHKPPGKLPRHFDLWQPATHPSSTPVLKESELRILGQIPLELVSTADQNGSYVCGCLRGLVQRLFSSSCLSSFQAFSQRVLCARAALRWHC